MYNNIYVLYGSQTGNAEEISKNIYDILNEKGYACTHSSLNKTIKDDSFTFIHDDEISIVIIVCSTTGNGDAPESANFFWRKLKNKKHPKDLLNSIEYSVLGLGDTNYDKFCQMGKNLDKRFNELGAKQIMELYCADEVSNFDETVELFIENIIKYFN